MEMAQSMQKLAHYRKNPRVRTHEPLSVHPKTNRSSVDLLEKIMENLPESEQKQLGKFTEVCRENSHSPIPSPIKNQRRSDITQGIIKSKLDKLKTYNCSFKGLNKDIKPNSGLFYEVQLSDLNSIDSYLYSLYIGNTSFANNSSLLLKHMIQGIITIGDEHEIEKYSSISNGYFVVPTTIENFVWETSKLVFKPLDIMLTKGNVLIHCQNGVSLAPVIAMIFLIKKFNLTYSQAREKVTQNITDVAVSAQHERDLKHLERIVICS